MPAEKAEKDQKCLYGFSRLEYENIDPEECCTLHLETMQISTKAYNLKGSPKNERNMLAQH